MAIRDLFKIRASMEDDGVDMSFKDLLENTTCKMETRVVDGDDLEVTISGDDKCYDLMKQNLMQNRGLSSGDLSLRRREEE